MGGAMGDETERGKAWLELARAVEVLQQKLGAYMSVAANAGCECCANCRVRGPVEGIVDVDGQTSERVFCYQLGNWRPVGGWCPAWPELNVRQ